MKRYSIIYYRTAEEMVPSAEQVESHARFEGGQPYYNWDNKQFTKIEATTLGGAYRAFTMSNPTAIVCAIEDLKLWNVSVAVAL